MVKIGDKIKFINSEDFDKSFRFVTSYNLPEKDLAIQRQLAGKIAKIIDIDKNLEIYITEEEYEYRLDGIHGWMSEFIREQFIVLNKPRIEIPDKMFTL